MRRQIATALIAALLAATAAAADEAAPGLPPVPDCGDATLGPPAQFHAQYRPGVDDPESLGALAVVGATLAYQCAGVTEDGSLVPEGWRVGLLAVCEDGICPLPPAVLVLDFAGRSFTATMRDDDVVRDVRLALLRSGRLTLSVRTRTGVGGVAVNARYLLLPADGITPSAEPARIGAAPRRAI